MSDRTSLARSSKKEKKAMGKSESSSPIITAIITAVGTIAVAYFAYRGIIDPKGLEISATMTAESFRASQTAEAKHTIPTDTLAPTVPVNTPDIPLPEVWPTSTSTPLPKQDFSTNCINATDWTPYTEIISYAQVNNCWDLSKSGIAAQDGKLSFMIQNDIPQSGSLYTLIPQKGAVKFTAKIDTFISGETNGSLVFGVGTVDGWLTNGEFLLFRAKNSGYYIAYGNSVTEVRNRTIHSYKMGSDVAVVFLFNALSFDIYVNDAKIVSDIPFPASNSRVFWIGYRLPEKSKLVGSISDFNIEK